MAGLSSLSNAPQTSVTQAPPLVSHPGQPPAAQPVTQPSASQSEGDKADALLAHMNAARGAEGTHELIRDADLDAVALLRAQDLLRLGYFEHYGPDGESAFSELRARGIKYRIAGENLARNNHPGDRTVTAAFELLMASPGHRANIVEPRFSSAGIAAVQQGKLWLYVTVFTN
ncbi:MAG: CAP domain-containing protein [Dehalococcoidia bacterium]